MLLLTWRDIQCSEPREEVEAAGGDHSDREDDSFSGDSMHR